MSAKTPPRPAKMYDANAPWTKAKLDCRFRHGSPGGTNYLSAVSATAVDDPATNVVEEDCTDSDS